MSADDTRIADRLAIMALNDDFGRLLDQGDVTGFVALFTDDVRYANGPRALNGRAEMTEFFTARAARGRVSRHLYSGLSITFDGPDRATGYSVWLTFAGDGALPIMPAEPFLVADITDVYARGPQGWRFAERRIDPVFRSAEISGPEGPAKS
ncbi:nuclear transport factor 2 family protein [Oricola sp.]|uniref:nuclear transport factor 2 family protein n=1 Tax=Oricola sp. TaxID=1979950 RepID=UPI0025F80AC5|nr:nuclear transport factor 2 family protein [Oricola sp.]MCI5075864.1 nuclear transport factor 2 family protein [Oricola sp.]